MCPQPIYKPQKVDTLNMGKYLQNSHFHNWKTKEQDVRAT